MDTTTQGWRILIDGHWGSGVESFVKTVCNHKPGTTGELLQQLEAGNQQLGRVAVDRDVVLSFFGNNTSNDGWVWEAFDQHLLGVLIVFDSTHPGFFEEAAEKARALRQHSPIPFVLVANKQDFDGAWSIEEIRRAMRIAADMPLVGCVATDTASVREVLLTLLQIIQRDIERG